MTLVPNRFLFRVSYPCPHVQNVPKEKGEDLLALPETCRLNTFMNLDGQEDFADVRIAWNDLGIAFQAEVTGKDREPEGDSERARSSDGVTLWIDTRDARTVHRASRYCHQFHLLPTGGGADNDEPIFLQTKIHRATQDAPLCAMGDVPFRCHRLKTGYRVEAFLPADVLSGYDPEQHPRLGIFYLVRDTELGQQMLGVDGNFPFSDDPSLWSVLELSR